MLAIRHILFPVDFSERTCGAVPYVSALAAKFGARVTLMHVVPRISYVGLEAPLPPSVYDDTAMRADAQSRLNDSLLKEFASLSVQRIVEVGDPADLITRFAHTEGVDLIMMPTHGYGPFRRLLLGSVTAKVLHDADCPVWTGAHVEQPPALEHVACRTVLCAVDSSPKTASLASWASDFAEQVGATLRLIHVVHSVEGWPERQLNQEFERTMRDEARANIVTTAASVGVRAPVCIAAGSIASAVSEEAAKHRADLVMIGRGVIHETLGRLRTHAHAIIREAPCPVISV